MRPIIVTREISMLDAFDESPVKSACLYNLMLYRAFI